MPDSIDTLRNEALAAVEKAASAQDVEQLRVEYLGKSGKVTTLLKSMGALSQRAMLCDYLLSYVTHLREGRINQVDPTQFKTYIDNIREIRKIPSWKSVASETLKEISKAASKISYQFPPTEQDLKILEESALILKEASKEDTKKRGSIINQFRDELDSIIGTRKAELENVELEEKLLSERIDITLPARPEGSGFIHPISQVMDEITAIFADMGFTVAMGPEIENDYHNFTALNIPEDHPARQMHDTFYLPKGKNGETLVLRTHTSPVQIRAMMNQQPPLRVIAPGATYRCDSDQTHTPMFHQVEGLAIDRHIHMGHLKGCLVEFVKTFFGLESVPVRFRNSFFPFTEPSAEMDIGCKRGKGELKIGEGDDWLEILGCGMVHPNVLKNCGIDPEEWQGFAFGMGVERLAMLKYGIPDLRTFFDSDIRWLKHYGFKPLDIPTLAGGL